MSETVAIEAKDAVPAQRPERLYNWDRVRVFASFDIIGFHVNGVHFLAGTGLPLFLMLSTALASKSKNADKIGTQLRSRFRSILLPWVFWVVLLTLGAIATKYATGNPLWSWTKWNMLFYGPMIHLWYLPFIAIVCPLFAYLQTFVPQKHRFYLAVINLVWGLAILPISGQSGLPFPFHQWTFAMPAVAFGLVIGDILRIAKNTKQLRTYLFTLAAIVIGYQVCIHNLQSGPIVLRFTLALAILAIATALPNPEAKITKHFTALALGVYIIHPVLHLYFFSPVYEKFGIQISDFANTMIIYAASALTILFLRTTPIRRFV